MCKETITTASSLFSALRTVQHKGSEAFPISLLQDKVSPKKGSQNDLQIWCPQIQPSKVKVSIILHVSRRVSEHDEA